MAFKDLKYAEWEIMKIPLEPQEWVRFGRVVRLDDKGFLAKENEAHITVVYDDLAPKLDALIAECGEIEAQIARAIDNAAWSQPGCSFARGSLHHVAKDKDRVDEQGNPFKLHVESIIQRVEVPGIGAFYEVLSEIVGQSLEAPPTHVTLYTLGDPRGISLPDRQAWEDHVKRELSPEELMRVC